MTDGVSVPVTGNAVAWIDEIDVPSVMAYQWRLIEPSPGCRYAVCDMRRSGFHTLFGMHTLITGWDLVDHRDRNGLNNRRSNLRSANKSLNAANSRKRSGSRNTYRGAIWRPGSRWEARIQGRYLGTFKTEEAAARAYDAEAGKAFGEFARLNFPEES